jgi:hypothetical protein
MSKSKKRDSESKESVVELLHSQFNARIVSDSGAVMASTIGIRLPHLSQRMLFQRSSLPLERTIVIYGPTGSNKSTLLYEFYRLFWQNGGKYFHLDVEDKDTPTMRLSLTGYDRTAGDSRTCESLDEYQEQVHEYLDWFRGVCTAKGGPGKVCPVAIGIDSLVAKMTADASNKVDIAHGRTERRFADEARALADWFKYIPPKLRGLPICLLGVNHDKPKTNQQTGQPVHNTPGGSAPNYFSTFKIYAEKVNKVKQTADGFEGNRIKLVVHKNSLGADNRSTEVEVVWRTVRAESVSGSHTTRQETMWNWNKATTQHLFRMQGTEGNKKDGARGTAVNDLLALRRHTGGKYTSRPLGVTEPVSAYRMAVEIEKAGAVLEQLEPVLGIHASIHYQPGVDYDDQLKSAVGMVDTMMPVEPPPAEPLEDSDEQE